MTWTQGCGHRETVVPLGQGSWEAFLRHQIRCSSHCWGAGRGSVTVTCSVLCTLFLWHHGSFRRSSGIGRGGCEAGGAACRGAPGGSAAYTLTVRPRPPRRQLTGASGKGCSSPHDRGFLRILGWLSWAPSRSGARKSDGASHPLQAGLNGGGTRYKLLPLHPPRLSPSGVCWTGCTQPRLLGGHLSCSGHPGGLTAGPGAGGVSGQDSSVTRSREGLPLGFRAGTLQLSAEGLSSPLFRHSSHPTFVKGHGSFLSPQSTLLCPAALEVCWMY